MDPHQNLPINKKANLLELAKGQGSKVPTLVANPQTLTLEDVESLIAYLRSSQGKLR